MVTAFQCAATVFGVLGALEGVRSLTLWREQDPETSSSAAAAALLLSLALIFVVMARIDTVSIDG